MGYGVQGFLGISKQNSFNVATASWDFVPIISETLVTNLAHLVEEGQRGRYEEGPIREGLLTVAGDITFLPHPILIGHFLRGVMGQASSTVQNSAFLWEFLPVQSEFDATFSALPPYTLQVNRDVTSAWQFTDAVVNKLKIEIVGGAIVKAVASMLCRVSSLMTKSTPSYPSGNSLVWDAASYSIAGAASANIESCTIDVDNQVVGVTALNATRLHAKFKRNGARKFKLSGVMDFADLTEYNQFRSTTAQAIVLSLLGDVVATSYNNLLKFDMPQVLYDSFPVSIPGPGRITANFTGVPVYNTTSSYAVRTTLVNTRGTY